MLILHRNLGRNPSCFKKAFAIIRKLQEPEKFNKSIRMNESQTSVFYAWT